MRKFVLSLAVLALVASPAFAGRYNKIVSVGDKAPVFSDIPALTKSGETTTLALGDLKEDVVVLVFLANHCPVVGAYDDRIIDFAKDYTGKGVKVVGVSVSRNPVDNLAAIKTYMTEKKINYVYGSDESQAIGKAYGATNTPQFIVIDKDRTIRYLGAMDDSQDETRVKKTYLRDAVDAVLKGESVEISETQPKGCSISYSK
jgi:peroxiredoxin